MKMQVGQKVDPFQVSGSKSLSIPLLTAKYTHLQFRRWAGCPICSTHMADFRRNGTKVKAAGIDEVIFFHSPRSQIAEFQQDFPFELIADQEKVFYRKFGVESSVLFFANIKTLWAAIKGLFSGNFNLKLGGGITGLPADILLDQGGTVVAVKYGKDAYDQWSADDLIEIVTNRLDKK
jgi:peroxiredoxin